LKKTLTSAPILRVPDWNVIFHVHIDASNFAIGCVLTQPGEHKLDYPISFASRQLNDAERNYTTTEREGLAMIYVVKKFSTTFLPTSLFFMWIIKHCCI
ncbi:ribonuclease H family protein, partial [Enterobacter cloacae complex sp. GF14B]|uniref:ribonuclease H family protein n=1 Tax=Enterobacter cloacae complex sp. GF14B TaxID=2511982 RepID=UPI00159EE81C